MTEPEVKILLIEDEPGIAGFIRQGLQEENYIVTWEADGNRGARLAVEEEFDLFLLDWVLPGVSGIDICRLIRNKGKETPVIFITAKDTVQDTVEALKSGADDYIKKPFHFEELMARIDVQLRKNIISNKELRLNHILLIPNKREVFVNEVLVHLTVKEFDLLHYLISNKNQVCERKKIIEEVWDIHFDYDTSVLDVYMNSIRKKLGLNKEDEILQTIRGVGYMAKEK
ncbi:MAG: response regulator transcription factor [Flavobacteriaceae bacterium]|nr:response regulator transcription factor [Flavobacteriaceae bacterium]